MLTTVFRLFIKLVSLMPLSMARAVGRSLGYITWKTNSQAAYVTRTNLELCFPDMDRLQRETLVRSSLQNWGMTIFEVPVIWRQGKKALDLITMVNGEEKVRQQLASGKGTIIISPHLGNWEIAGLWVSNMGPTTILYQPPRQAGLEDIVSTGRSQGGATLVPTSLRGVSALIKALKNGEITGILPDMEPDEHSGIFAPFFGIPALTMTLIHNLQQRSGAGLLLAFARRTPEGFTIEILEPDADLYHQDAEISVTALNQLVERSVLIAPEQYQWEYKRFKTGPEGRTRRYNREPSRKSGDGT